MISLPLASSALCLFVSAGPAVPIADVYVDLAAASCATGTGTLGSPVCSIGDAIALAAPGDIIRIAPGTYFENVLIGFDLDLVGTGGASVTTIDGGAQGSVVTIPTAVTVIIDGLTITNGLADQGGGILADGNLALTNSTISGNTATSQTRGGGGIGHEAFVDRFWYITNSVIQGNTSANDGGGVNIRRGICVFDNSTIRDNISTGDGGGINTDGPVTLSVVATTVSGNSGEHGGGIAVNSGQILLQGSTLSNNSAVDGGGFWTFFGTVTAINSTISGNYASSRTGGVHVFSTNPGSFSNVTITNNSVGSADQGAGLEHFASYGGLEIRNSIVAGNNSTQGMSDATGIILSQGYNIFGTLSYGNSPQPSDVVGITGSGGINGLVGPLQDNGGPTFTHALPLGSIAIDAGDPLVFQSVDQRGVARPLDAGPDIGAFENDFVATPFCFGEGSGTSCPCGNNSILGHAGGCANSAGDGAILALSGIGSVSHDSLAFDLSSASPSSFALLVSGDNLLPQTGGCIGCGIVAFDGLRCAGGNFARHGSRATNVMGSTTNGWGPPGAPTGGLLAANGFTAGQIRHFFAFYREDVALGCQTGQNSSNGVSVTFLP